MKFIINVQRYSRLGLDSSFSRASARARTHRGSFYNFQYFPASFRAQMLSLFTPVTYQQTKTTKWQTIRLIISKYTQQMGKFNSPNKKRTLAKRKEFYVTEPKASINSNLNKSFFPSHGNRHLNSNCKMMLIKRLIYKHYSYYGHGDITRVFSTHFGVKKCLVGWLVCSFFYNGSCYRWAFISNSGCDVEAKFLLHRGRKYERYYA